MSTNNSSEYILVNAYDELVKQHVRLVMGQNDVCQCEKCFLDACALVYNQGYTHFVTTVRGQLLAQVSEQKAGKQADLTVKVMEALHQIKLEPRH